MLIKKKNAASVPREDAHGGSGGRRLYVTDGDLENRDFSAMTYSLIPAGAYLTGIIMMTLKRLCWS